VLEQAFGHRTIDRCAVRICAGQFTRFAIGGGLAWEERGSIDRIVGDAAWNSLGAKCADEPVARDSERGFVDQKYECVNYFARDARIARDWR